MRVFFFFFGVWKTYSLLIIIHFFFFFVFYFADFILADESRELQVFYLSHIIRNTSETLENSDRRYVGKQLDYYVVYKMFLWHLPIWHFEYVSYYVKRTKRSKGNTKFIDKLKVLMELIVKIVIIRWFGDLKPSIRVSSISISISLFVLTI